MRFFKTILLSLLICFVIIQFFQPDRTKKLTDSKLAFREMYAVPAQVQQIMQNACYSCHSNDTQYPWYSYVQPAGWFLDHHIRLGREHLNLSEFGKLTSRTRISKIKEMTHEIKGGDMPMSSYTMMHKEAELQPADKTLLVSWLGHLTDSLMIN